MTLSNLVLSSLLLANSTGWRVERIHALHDLSDNASFIYGKSILIPEGNSTSKIGNSYYLSVYQEKEIADTAVPLRILGTFCL